MMSKNNRNSSYTGRKSWVKYAGLTVALAVICTVAFFALLKTDVFGKFEAVEPYVVERTVKDHVDQIVTDEGNNQKGEKGTGATPCSDEVPTCVGEKGSKTNPFVVLEIVPDKSQQQLAYLGQDEDNVGPLDMMKIGIDYSKDTSKKLPDLMAHGDFQNYFAGRWFLYNKYSVYKIPTAEEEKGSLPFAYVDKEFYTLEFDDDKINMTMGYDSAAEEFAKIYNDFSGLERMKKLSEDFPKLFTTDKDGKVIRKDEEVNVFEDNYNWKISQEVTVTPEDSEEFKAPGYMVMVEPGKGEFGFASLEDAKKWRFTKTGTDADRWVYVEDEAAMEQNQKYAEYLEKYDVTGGIWSNGFYYPDEKGDKGPWHNGLQDLYNDQENPQFTGLIYKIDNWITCKYVKSPEKKENKYKFVYSALRNNNILKRALFMFESKEEYDNFHMKVITMTPAELNQISQKDTPSTVDMIERADMYYIQSGMKYNGEPVDPDGTKKLQNFYEKYVKKVDENHKNDTFYENDLEWTLCQKIIQRQSKVRTLPLVFSQMVGELLSGGISRQGSEDVHIYLMDQAANQPKCLPEKGSRNNIAKLFLITSQFDLLSDDSGVNYKRTFMEHIYPYIKTISIPKENGVVDGTATTTGYYDYDGTLENNSKKLCSCNKPNDFKERVYYLWNAYTFMPQDMDVELNDPFKGCNGDLEKEERKKIFYELGYLPTIFENEDSNHPFQSNVSSHLNGSDGTDGKNVTFLHQPGKNPNTNFSSFIGNNDSDGDVSSVMLNIIYLILNNKVQTAQPVTVKVEAQKKMYVKLTEDTVMIDYEDDGKKSPTDKDLYVKVRIKNNGNNRPGQVRKIFLNNSKGEPSKELKLYTDKACKTEYSEMWKREEGDPVEWYKGVPEEGYSVPRDNGYIVGYVKFTLNEWKIGYNELSFDTVGRSFIVQKNNPNGGELRAVKRTTPISIIGKTLFDLE